MKKLFSSSLLKPIMSAVMLLTICVLVVSFNAEPAQAATVVHQSPYETVTLFSKADIESYTGITLTHSNIAKVRAALGRQSTWETAGYPSNQAAMIAQRFNLSVSQANGILTSMAYHNTLNLKVVVVTKPYYTNVNIGSQELQHEIDPGETQNPEDNQNPEQNTEFKKLQIQIQYGKKEIEIQYEVKASGSVKAEYQNELTGEKLKDAAAQAKIQALLKGFDFRAATHSEIEAHVLNFLGQSTNYRKFEFEARFTDGSEIEFER